MVPVYGSRYVIASGLWCILYFPSDDECTPGSDRRWIHQLADAFYLSDGYADESVPIDPLSGKLVLLYRNP